MNRFATRGTAAAATPWRGSTAPIARLLAVGMLTATLTGCLAGEASQSASNDVPAGEMAQTTGIARRIAAPITTEDAARFLDQATFGATDEAIAAVKRLGFEGYLEDQFARAPTQLPMPDPIYGNFDVICRDRYVGANDGFGSCWRDFYTAFPVQTGLFRAAVNGDDQVRLRLAFTLSQILVTSSNEVREAYAIAAYQQMLVNHALGNYRTLLKEVTLSPTMGRYLSLVDSAKADPVTGTQPNENYARELMQLFSLGPYLLNPDGSTKRDETGAPIPTYDQTTVKETARALTGWTLADRPGYRTGQDYRTTMLGRMIPAPRAHDTGRKVLIGDRDVPAGQSPEADVDAVVDAMMAHPNIAPFIARLLIQFHVTSNPSGGYVRRVARVFGDNGAGERGDLRAVLKAVLLDPEARAVSATRSAGRVREPVLLITNLLRTIGATTDGVWPLDWSRQMAQPPYEAPSVFNFYPADFQVPGTAVNAPAFKLLDAGSMLARSNLLKDLLFTDNPSAKLTHVHFSDTALAAATGTAIGWSKWTELAGDPRVLVAELNTRLLYGRMSNPLQQIILSTITPLASSRSRAALALYLVAISPEFQVAR